VPKKNVSVKLEEGLVDRLEREADEKNMTRSDHLREIINQRHANEEVTRQLREEHNQLEEEYENKIEKKDKMISFWKDRANTIEEKATTAALDALEEKYGEKSVEEERLQQIEEKLDEHDETMHAKLDGYSELFTLLHDIQDTLEQKFEATEFGLREIADLVEDDPDEDADNDSGWFR